MVIKLAKGLISIRFASSDDNMEKYCRQTLANVKTKLMAETGDFDVYMKFILYELCKKYNNGYSVDIKTPETVDLEEVVALYDQPSEKERISKLIEIYHAKGKESLNSVAQSELTSLSFDLLPEGKRDMDRIVQILEVRYLKILGEEVINPTTKKTDRYMYLCDSCETIHYSGNVLFDEHLNNAHDTPILTTESFPEDTQKPVLESLPYYCSECKRNHVKGKLFETHREFKGVKP